MRAFFCRHSCTPYHASSPPRHPRALSLSLRRYHAQATAPHPPASPTPCRVTVSAACSKGGASPHGQPVSWPAFDVSPFADCNKPRDLACDRDDGVVVTLTVHGLSSKKELPPIVLATGELALDPETEFAVKGDPLEFKLMKSHTVVLFPAAATGGPSSSSPPPPPPPVEGAPPAAALPTSPSNGASMDDQLLNERRWGVSQVRFLPKAPARKLLYFVRHAESNWNAAQSSMNGRLSPVAHRHHHYHHHIRGRRYRRRSSSSLLSPAIENIRVECAASSTVLRTTPHHTAYHHDAR